MAEQRPRRRPPSFSFGTFLLVLAGGGCLFIAILTMLGPATGNVFSSIMSSIDGSPGGPAPRSPAVGSQPAAPTSPAANSPGGHGQQVAQHLIIKDGTIALIVDDPRGARRTIEAMVAEFAGDGAFVVAASETGGSGDKAPTINMTIRVPAARFDDAMNRIAGLARTVVSREEQAQDVTEDYVDSQARLDAMQAAHDRLLGFMESATTTADLMSLEQQLTTREGEIEALKGKLQFLSQSALLSKIAISLQPYVPPAVTPPPPPEPWWLGEVVRVAVASLESTARVVASTLVFFGIAWLPWLTILGLLAGAGLLIRRRLSRSARAG